MNKHLFLLIALAAVFGSSLSTSSALAAPSAATLSITNVTQATSASSGEVTADLMLNTGGQAVSSVSVNLLNTPTLRYTDIDYTGSVFSTQVNQARSSDTGIEFSRVRTDTGYTGTSGLIAKLTYSIDQAGASTITIDQKNSAVFAFSDSSNILQNVVNGAITVTTPRIPVVSPAAISNPGAPTPVVMSDTHLNEAGLPQSTTTNLHPRTTSASVLAYLLLIVGAVLLIVNALRLKRNLHE